MINQFKVEFRPTNYVHYSNVHIQGAQVQKFYTVGVFFSSKNAEKKAFAKSV